LPPKPLRRITQLDPYWQTKDSSTVRLYQGHVIDVLSRLPAESIHMCVTSPPYWGLRDYGTGTWEGGDPGCDHLRIKPNLPKDPTSTLSGRATNQNHEREPWKNGQCGKCGARRIDMQLGSEPSPDCDTKGQAQCGRCFVCNMVAVFREVRRVLRDDGTLWLNLGDSYGGGGNTIGLNDVIKPSPKHNALKDAYDRSTGAKSGLPSGNLVGIPWRVALALQADGWILRQDIIWAKPSPMPESAKNRCTKAHEYVFLFAKRQGYYYDAEAVKESYIRTWNPETNGGNLSPTGIHKRNDGFSERGGKPVIPSSGANKRSVWSVDDHRALLDWLGERDPAMLEDYLESIGERSDVWRVSSQGYPGAHFATYPPKLIEPMIKAGTSEHGCCADCGTPWVRVTEEHRYATRPGLESKYIGTGLHDNETKLKRFLVDSTTLGWRPGCECNGRLEKIKTTKLVAITGLGTHEKKAETVNSREGSTLRAPLGYEESDTTVVEYVSDLPLDEHPVRPCVVLDPFLGSGTTVEVCIDLGRHCVGIDLSKDYLDYNAIPRIEGALMDRGTTAQLIPRPERKPLVSPPTKKRPVADPFGPLRNRRPNGDTDPK